MSNSDVINQFGCAQDKTFPMDVANALVKSAVFDANRHQFDSIQVASYVVIVVGLQDASKSLTFRSASIELFCKRLAASHPSPS